MKKIPSHFVLLLGVSLWNNVCSISTSLSNRALISSAPEHTEPMVELTESEIELISRRLKGTIDIPFLNNAMEKQIIQAALTSFCKAAPVALPEGLFRDLVSGKQDWNQVKEDVIHIINDEICIPVIPRQVQDQMVNSICTVMFTSKAEQKQIVGRAIRSTLSENSEEEFATMLNEMIDVPLMNEKLEQEVFLKLARSISGAFEQLVPLEMRDLLTHSSPEELQEARQNLIDRLNEKIDIPFKTEQEERKYFVVIVDFLLKRYGLLKDTKLPQEEWEEISRELDLLELELELYQVAAAEKLESMKAKRGSLASRKSELGDILGHGKDEMS